MTRKSKDPLIGTQDPAESIFVIPQADGAPADRGDRSLELRDDQSRGVRVPAEHHGHQIHRQLGVKGHDDDHDVDCGRLLERSSFGTQPELDAVSAHFEDDLGTVVAAVEQYVVNSVANEGVGRAVRFAHAKGYGLVRAEVEILGGLPPGYAQGIYATPGRHDALIRFSNGVAHLGADAALSNAFGLALKIFGVAGTTLVDDEPDAGTFDYNTINMPVFFCNTVAHYLFIQQLFTDAPVTLREAKTASISSLRST